MTSRRGVREPITLAMKSSRALIRVLVAVVLVIVTVGLMGPQGAPIVLLLWLVIAYDFLVGVRRDRSALEKLSVGQRVSVQRRFRNNLSVPSSFRKGGAGTITGFQDTLVLVRRDDGKAKDRRIHARFLELDEHTTVRTTP
jgi:hypothetical protein